MNGKVWKKHDKVIMRDGKVFFFKECPCDCTPKVIAKETLNGSTGQKCWDLTGYQGNEIGTPGGRWRLIEVDDPRNCGGLHYGEGIIDDCGKLIGLQNKFCSGFAYNGYMELQQGCYDYKLEKWVWPCPNGD